jgi:hypothetical protein
VKNITLLLAISLSFASLPGLAQIPANQLPLRIGADQSGGNGFRGEMAAIRLYDRALTAAEVKRLAETQPEAKGGLLGIVGEWLHPSLPVLTERKFDFPHGATIEAWIRPEASIGGRIVDKITPGGSDGFLLDTHPGNALRLIVGNDTITHPLPPSGRWTHVAATVDDSGLLTLFANGVRVGGSASEVEDVRFQAQLNRPESRSRSGIAARRRAGPRRPSLAMAGLAAWFGAV